MRALRSHLTTEMLILQSNWLQGRMSFYKTKAHHVIFFLFGVLEVIFTSGIIYGWASMRFVLEREGYYEDLCHSPTKNVSSNGTYEAAAGSDTKTNLCSERIERLNLVFVLSVSLLCGVQYPFGIIIDKYGARKMRIAGLILIAAGGIVLAFLPSGAGDGLFFVFIIVSCGGSALFMSTCQVVSITYGKLKALVMCVIHGSFDSSAVMLVLFKLAYERGASLKAICLTYTGLVVVMAIPATIFLYPPLRIVKKWHEFVGDRKQLMALRKDETSALNDCKVNPYTEDTAYEKTDVLKKGIAKSAVMDAKKLNNTEKIASILIEENAAGKFGDAQPTLTSLRSCILSPLFALALFFISAVQLNLWFFIGALDIVLNRLTHGDESLISLHVNIFGYAQFCGFAVGPVIGVLFDGCTVAQKSSAYGRRPLDYADKVRTAVVPYAVTLLMSILLCCLALSGRLTAMFPAYILYVFLRGFLYASNATFVSIAFPTEFFGRLYGLNMMLSGAFGFLQHLLVALTADQFKKDPFWMNLALLLLNCACAVLPIYIVFFVKRIKSKKTSI